MRNEYFYWIVMVAALYLVTVSTIYRFKNPKMTETELFLNLPNAIVLDFEN